MSLGLGRQVCRGSLSFAWERRPSPYTNVYQLCCSVLPLFILLQLFYQELVLYLSVSLFLCLVSLSVCLSLCLPLCLFVSLFLFVTLSLFLSVYPSLPVSPTVQSANS